MAWQNLSCGWNFEDKWKWEFLCNYHSPPVSDSGWNPSYDNLQMHENQKFDNSIIFTWFKKILFTFNLSNTYIGANCIPAAICTIKLISEFIPKKENQLTGCLAVAVKK